MCKTLAVSSQNVSQRGMLVNLSSHFKHHGDMEIKGFAKVSRVPVCQRFILNRPTIHIRQLSPFAYISFISPPDQKKNNNNNNNPISDSKIKESLNKNPKAEEIGSCLNGFFGALIDIITSSLDPIKTRFWTVFPLVLARRS